MIPFAPQIIAAAVIGVVAFGSGWSVNGWRLNSKHDAEVIAAQKAYSKQLSDMTAQRDTLAGKLFTANDKHTSELRKAQDETNALRDRVSAGAGRLRIAAKCPTPATTPENPASPSVDSGTGAELDPTARRAYFSLRDGIDRASVQLAACQDELRLRAVQ